MAIQYGPCRRSRRRTQSVGRSMMKRLAKGVFRIALLVVPAVVHAGDVRVVYYDISASTGRQLIHEMETRGPLDPQGKRVPAYTIWHVTWNYRYQSGPESCKLTDLTVEVDGTMTLPRWVDSGTAPKSLVQSWQSMMAALRVHEDGHYAHGVEAAREIAALREATPPAADCASLQRQFNAEATSILDKYAALDAKYDQDTRHGQTQGAILIVND
ncbi:MAG: DUF922 domain-containing Zn-dependent protease [Proteobacteria bacterium]|nr:DUF922 domain-containing Zn-dependent protease [Pseudomonadota bacterium]